MPKKYSILIIAAIVVAAILGLWSLSKKKAISPKPSDTQVNLQPTEQKRQSQITKVDENSLPEKFPADFPIEAGAEILQNYNAEDKDTYQATRQFSSKKTVAENYKFYGNYFKTSGWTISGQNDGNVTKSITAKKDGGTMSISISKNQALNIVVVDASYTLKK